MDTKSFWPLICSTPTILFLAGLFYSALFGPLDIHSKGLVTAIILLPVVAFTICVAMMFVKSGSREWKIAAIFTSSPIILALFAWFLQPGR